MERWVMSDVSHIAVIGAGTMGSGIALTSALAGKKCTLVDVQEPQLDIARSYHDKQLSKLVAKEKLTNDEATNAQSLLNYTIEISDASSADWAIEAATENVDVKKTLFQMMRDTFGEEVVLATNTSSISITDLATAVVGAEERVIGMHFFNPVPVMKLVEVIKGNKTSEATTNATIALSEALGKIPVPANDFAGFVSNRVLMPMINEAFHAWEDGVADPDAIDSIMKLGCAFPMGPLRLADYIGLDVCRDIMMVMYNGLDENPKYLPNHKLVDLVEAGKLGDKSGSGVYDYTKE